MKCQPPLNVTTQWWPGGQEYLRCSLSICIISLSFHTSGPAPHIFPSLCHSQNHYLYHWNSFVHDSSVLRLGLSWHGPRTHEYNRPSIKSRSDRRTKCWCAYQMEPYFLCKGPRSKVVYYTIWDAPLVRGPRLTLPVLTFTVKATTAEMEYLVYDDE
jgi:hypothetical protein